jgi:hypothetical protein
MQTSHRLPGFVPYLKPGRFIRLRRLPILPLLICFIILRACA